MNSLLKQDVGWFDQNDQYKLSSEFNADALSFQKATGEKMGGIFSVFSMFVCGAAIALSIRWTMALVILASLPVIAIGCIIFMYLINKKNSSFQ